MIEQLKQYDLFARNLFETILFVREKYENDFTIDRGKYREILDHLTKDIPILVTNKDVIEAYNKKYKVEDDEEMNNARDTF